MKIKLLVVDDSLYIQRLFADFVADNDDIELVGIANDPYEARELIKQLNPDVITLDIEMPKMNGLAFLEKLMRLHPMPVLMISSLTEKGADATLRAMSLGAVDFMQKPNVHAIHELKAYAHKFIEKVIAVSQSKNKINSYSFHSAKPVFPNQQHSDVDLTSSIKLIALGSSTGGTEAVSSILKSMPSNSPPIVITQHIPPKFSEAFANRLNNISAINVVEARDNQQILPGYAYVAPGGYHMEVKANRTLKVYMGDDVNRHCPSVDVLFDSIAIHAARNSIGVILTGMGKDGALGLSNMHKHGATTVAQDEESSIVWGMPKAAINLGCVDTVTSLEKIPALIQEICSKSINSSVA